MNKCIEVLNDEKRFALTVSQVQNKDIIKVTSTKKVYLVSDENQLSTENGYIEYTKYLNQTGGRVIGEIIADNIKVGNNNVWHAGNFDPESIKGGTSIPPIEPADNKRFLRNDNTWQTVTPANIGAAEATHTHTEYLSSQGNITVNGNLTVTGEILSNNNVTAYSDIRVKKNIRDIDDSVIEKLKKVRFCNFEYKDCKENRKRVGVIAQELEELFPELVFEDHNGIKTVDYTGLNVYFAFAMQKKLFG